MEKNSKPDKPGMPKFNMYWVYGLLALFLLGLNLLNPNIFAEPNKIDWTKFEQMARDGDVDRVEIVNEHNAYIYVKADRRAKYVTDNKKRIGADEPVCYFNIGKMDMDKRDKELNAQLTNKVPFSYVEHNNYVGQIFSWLLPFLLLLAVWLIVMRRMGGGSGGPGSQIFNIGKSRATMFDANSKVDITFADVAGLDEAKVEVVEIVDFLKNPKKYTTLGGKIPKGVLLVGAPGTGKTLLAKAVAGEAGVPFFSISGSDFVEMFVGVGASRVRDLFRQAREKAPCIIFIDEIDAIGRARGRGQMQGGNDERENTLNQLLVEMDGFPTDKGVIMMAATNRPDILDAALMRPGRFDRQITIDRPDLVGREQIFNVHLKTIKTSPEINAAQLSEMTPGFAGAEIANVCNEAALIAARHNKKFVELDDFNQALDRVIGGLEKKNKLISPNEKRIIAYHEAGHAICGWYLEHAYPLTKVSIVPRGVAAGYAQYLPKEEYITRTEQLLDRMCMTLGGRAAESNMFDKISTGALSDLETVTQMAYSMIAVYGMNKNVGNLSFYKMSQEQYNRPYSEETAKLIDNEVRKLIEGQYERAKALLIEKRPQLDLLANALLANEVVLKSDLERMIGKRPTPEDEHPVVSAIGALD
jgi:AFG3 family protein